MAFPQVDWVCEVFKYENSECNDPNWLYIAKSPKGDTLVKFLGHYGASPWHKGQATRCISTPGEPTRWRSNEVKIKFNAWGNEAKLRHVSLFKVQDEFADMVWTGHDYRGREIKMTLDRVMKLSPELVWFQCSAGCGFEWHDVASQPTRPSV